jgi:hypothetical protein
MFGIITAYANDFIDWEIQQSPLPVSMLIHIASPEIAL